MERLNKTHSSLLTPLTGSGATRTRANETTPPAGAEGTPPAAPAATPAPTGVSQAEFDALKATADRLQKEADDRADAEKTDLEKARDAETRLQNERDNALAELKAERLRNVITAEARKAGFANPDAAYRLIENASKLDPAKVEDITAAVTAYAEAESWVKGAPQAEAPENGSGGGGGGGNTGAPASSGDLDDAAWSRAMVLGPGGGAI